MNIRPVFRKIILLSAMILLLVIAWVSISGALSQMTRPQTTGQAVETVLQIVCGVLSILTVCTCFFWKKIRRPVRLAWRISLMATAGISSVVWGPPMLIVAVLFLAVSFLAAQAIIRLLQIGGA
jgi:hypothetical protein